jgi:hypothetical protein
MVPCPLPSVSCESESLSASCGPLRSSPAVPLTVWSLGFSLALLLSPQGTAAAPEFNKLIRPILAEHCFKCHGSDEKARKGKLRLDVRDEALAKKAIVPGDASHSKIVERIFTTDADDLMPPPDAHLDLSDADKASLKAWIAAGAVYQKHWAFIAPVAAKVPEMKSQESGGNPIDAFVLASLEARHLQPAPPASPEQWLRRVTIALTGLPPTLDEIDAFLADPSPDSHQHVVDRLLGSPAYGEHLARDWMDAARYADTYGRHEDGDMVAWPWRDWVIRAFNSNLPYDQFIQWQTAGDMMPHPSREQLVATEFNRLAPQSNESGNDPLEFRLDQVSDRVRVNGLAFMGLTMECAKCHDHKFDPITQKEYWRMAAVFDNIDENGVYSQFCPKAVPSPSIILPTEVERVKLEAVRWQIRAIETELNRIKSDSRAEYDRWIATNGVPGALKDGWWNTIKSWFGDGERNLWKPEARGRFNFESVHKKENKILPNLASKSTSAKLRARLAELPGPVGRAALFEGDDEITFSHPLGEYHRYEPFSFSLWLSPQEDRDRAVVLAWSRGGIDDGRGYEMLLQHEVPEFALMHFHPGNEIRIRAKEPLPLNQWTHVAVSYDGSSRADGLKMWLNGVPADVETVENHLEMDIVRRQEWGDIDRDEVVFTLGGRYHDNPLKNCGVDEFHIFSRALGDGEAKWLAGKTASADEWYDWWLGARDDQWRQMAHALKLHRKKETALVDDILEVMVMQERPQQRAGFVRVRGDYKQPADEVQPGTPRAILPFPDSLPRNRLGFAQWLTSPEHPLTARVAVNRLWQLIFGAGLVRTPQDFGTRGEMPTHPELLDWLACDFMKHGWDVKRLARMIALSATFAQSASPQDTATLQSDPENRLLARGPRVRLTAEEVRDQALVASGLLCSQVGGPSVHAYMPKDTYRDAALQQPFILDRGDKLNRRSLYSFWRRTLPPPELAAFDAPTREFCVVKREATTSPAQALMLLNQTQFVEAQRILAQQLVRTFRDDPASRCATAFRLLTTRQATAPEMDALVRLLQHQREFFQQHPSNSAAMIVTNGNAPMDPSLPSIEVASTTMMVRALMSHDEALNR